MRLLSALVVALSLHAATLSDKPDAAFKLATYSVDGGKDRVAMVFGSRIVDIAEANKYVSKKTGLTTLAMPVTMMELIEGSTLAEMQAEDPALFARRQREKTAAPAR